MPRASRADAAHHREEIVAESSRLFRERGFAGVSVADVTGAVGLTHGGFYKHFASKEALAAEASAEAFRQSVELGDAVAAGFEEKTEQWRAGLDAYFSDEHRDVSADGCPATALAADAAREPVASPIHAAYVAGLESYIDFFQRIAPGDATREETIVRYAAMVGALTLARATHGEQLSDEIFQAVRKSLEC
ncbi:TetR/AcrR family transcriptional regulator [soil metagenome]